MRAIPPVRSLVCAALLAVLAACGGATGPDKVGPAAAIAIVSGNAQTAQVATALPQPLVVTVTDAKARPVTGASVTWSVVSGNGVINPAASVTDANGNAQTVLTAGTQAGNNQVSASVSGVATPVTFAATGTAGPLAKVVASAHALPLCTNGQQGHLSATTSDLYGNPVSGTVSWTSRNPSAVAVDNAGNVSLLSATVGAYVVASSGSAAPDSALVSPAPVLTLAAAAVNVSLPGGNFCVQSTRAGSEFALIAYNASTNIGTSVGVQVQGNGVAALGSGANVVSAMMAPPAGAGPGARINTAFEYALRRRERALTPPYVAGARAYARALRQRPAAGISAQTVGAAGTAVSRQITDAVQVGSMVQLNTNANDYCTNPTMATGRVAAVSQSATVVADTSNPAGGFTDAEYAGFAAAMDTLVNPVDTNAFGAPYPLGGNKRTVIFFTKAVNQLTTDPSQGVVLGFYYERDLLPQNPTTGTPCPGSNYANMFYVLVPDPNGTINGGNTISKNKALVTQYAISTIGHEYQHLINASRRMYILNVPPGMVNEETWLNEGLSHIAEDLIFYRAAGLGPRQNIGVAQLADPKVNSAFGEFERGDASRFLTYLTSPETHAPVGVEGDDNLYLRGAVENFLRYLCDRVQGTDGDFWYRLVNDSTIGLPNLQHVIGTDPEPYFRDWATSVYTDDYVAGVAPQYTQLSWNWRQALAVEFTSGFNLLTHPLSSSIPATVALTARGVSYFPFAVPVGQEALITVGAPAAGALPGTVQLTLVRTK
ncbi:MAG: Ig-like domain-containing protein [Gemmatimonadota bacterium]|nr:Ig-like domain-containing protein [Gemmatimonadota bacterium]